ncbi:MAG: aminodeoxychorismate synthase component I [Planctomycetes bacterium]|nr:aminodeoxychorismate synthase component I [Planctomycetota bacterium]
MAVRTLDDSPSAYDVFQATHGQPQPFFLDSGLGIGGLGKRSFVGSTPFLTLTAKGKSGKVVTSAGEETFRGSPFAKLRELFETYRMPQGAKETPFVGGAVGYFGYDLCHHVERLPDTAIDDIRFPDMHLAFYDHAFTFDHETGACILTVCDVNGGDPEKTIEERLAVLRKKLGKYDAAREPSRGAEGEIECNFTREEYLRAVEQAKKYIAAGDIFQVNLSQRFHIDIACSPRRLHNRLRRINPAPFAAYLEFGDCAVVSASPERFLRVRDRHVETRPIKGTRPRTGNERIDKQMRTELLASPKDNAELAMIVDLERNDIGRVCSYGTVRVTQKCVLEEHPTVYHLVSTVEGDLHEGRDLVDLLKATFPGGSITGAPKIRSMEIIDELEPTKRAVYTGAIGYIGFDGTMDLNIVIRTFLVKGRRAFFQVGGGIVADSEPESEYDETLAKAKALIEAARA